MQTDTIDNNTRLTISVAGDRFTTTLGLLLADNDPSALDRDAIVAALAAGEVYTAGGGAAPDVRIEVA
jgi:hypothetical protein